MVDIKTTNMQSLNVISVPYTCEKLNVYIKQGAHNKTFNTPTQRDAGEHIRPERRQNNLTSFIILLFHLVLFFKFII